MFQVEKEYLVIGGKPRFIYAGDFSYGRIPRAVWRDRLLMMKAAGISSQGLLAISEIFCASVSSTPQLMAGSRRPSPRKERDVSPRIDWGMEMVMDTMM